MKKFLPIIYGINFLIIFMCLLTTSGELPALMGLGLAAMTALIMTTEEKPRK
jgi:hypothetical protein